MAVFREEGNKHSLRDLFTKHVIGLARLSLCFFRNTGSRPHVSFARELERAERIFFNFTEFLRVGRDVQLDKNELDLLLFNL